MVGNGSLHSGRAAYRTPGVYYEEKIRAPGIPGFRTGVPAFVGFVDAGINQRESSDTVLDLTRWEQFQQLFGVAGMSGFLGYAVRGFFANGGERCFVVPVHTNDQDFAAALTRPFSQGGILEDVEDIDLVCVPDAMPIAGPPSRDAVIDIQSAVLDHCHRMGNRFAILDAFPADANGRYSGGLRGDKGPWAPVLHWQGLPSSYGALYFPWIYVKEHTTRLQNESKATRSSATGQSAQPAKTTDGVRVPPCGHVAGIYARTDGRVGVHKAPANEIIEEALDLEIDITDDEQAELNDAGVNCLRSLPGRGIRVWGARTLSGQPGWLYTNVTRLFLTLTRWAEQNMHELTFEPNDASLWERTRQRISGYCNELFERGALKGRNQSEAFFVKCDDETNPPEAREAGRVIAEVGLAPAVPAEFVIVRLTQSNTGVTVAASMT